MLQRDYLITGEAPKCVFLNVIKYSEKNITVNMKLAYAPKTDSINKIMDKVKV